MKKFIFALLISLTLVFVPSIVSAQGTQQQNRVQDPITHEDAVATQQGNQTASQNQIQTQNQGENSQLQVATQQMEQLMNAEGLGEEVGNQLKTLAQEQMQTQTQIQEQLNKLDSKGGLARLLTGTDYQAVKNLKTQLEQNQSRIRQLEQLQNQLSNQNDTTMIQESIQVLNQENTVLQQRIAQEEQTKSLFGWLFKLFVN